MSAAAHKTRAEQRLEWLQSLDRPLTDEESEMLRRSLHAVYARNRTKERLLAAHRREEREMLAKVEAEAAQPERYGRER